MWEPGSMCSCLCLLLTLCMVGQQVSAALPAGGTWSLIAGFDSFTNSTTNSSTTSVSSASSSAASSGYWGFVYCGATSNAHTSSATGGTAYWRTQAVKDLVAQKTPSAGCDLWVYTGWISYVGYGQGQSPQDDTPPLNEQGLSAWTALEHATANGFPGFSYCNYSLNLNGGASGFAATGGIPYYRSAATYTPTQLYLTMNQTAPIGSTGWQCILFINTLTPYNITSNTQWVWYGANDILADDVGTEPSSTGLIGTQNKAVSLHWEGLVHGGDNLYYYKEAATPGLNGLWAAKKNCTQCLLYLYQQVQGPTTPAPTTIVPTTPTPTNTTAVPTNATPTTSAPTLPEATTAPPTSSTSNPTPPVENAGQTGTNDSSSSSGTKIEATIIAVIVGVGGGGLILIMLFLFCYRRHKRNVGGSYKKKVEEFDSSDPGRRIPDATVEMNSFIPEAVETSDEQPHENTHP